MSRNSSSVRVVACVTLVMWGLVGCAGYGPKFDPYNPAKEVMRPAEDVFKEVEVVEELPESYRYPPTDPYTIGAGDDLEIEMMETKGTTQRCKVMPDGKIYYHTAPGQVVVGLTVAEARTKLNKALSDYYRDPQVMIIVREVTSKRVWLMGRVNRPGLYPLRQPMTILEAVSQAGGLFTSRFSGTTEELADLRHSVLVRDGEFVPVDFNALLRKGDMSHNIYLKDGDYIYLPSALSQEVYVLGAVKQPRAVGFMDQVTLVSAISTARGLLNYGNAQHVVIIRGSLVKPKVAVVNFDDIRKGKAPDIKLKPRDIVWVPNSPWERVEKYLKSALNTFASTVSANEGARAGFTESQDVGTSINVGPE